MKILSVLLEITPNLATRAIETPLRSSMGTMWCLYDPTPSGSILTWEDLTTRFPAQFFPPRRTTKLCNDILLFQQHQVQIFYDHVNPATRRTIDQSVGGNLRDKNSKESWALLEDLTLYDDESWNDPRDFTKPVKAISLPQDVLMVPTILNIEWKIPSKLLLNMHPRVATKWEVSYSPPIKDQEPSTRLLILGRTNPTLVGQVLKPSQAREEKRFSKKIESTPTHSNPTNGVAHVNAISFDHMESQEPQNKATIKSPSKLLLPKYQAPSSLKTNSENSSSKRICFVNIITIVNKEEDPRNTPQVELNDLSIVRKVESSGTYEGNEEKEAKESSEEFIPDRVKEVTFKTPYKDPKSSELTSEGHDLLSSRIIPSDDDYDRGCRKPSDLKDGFYRDTIKIGPEYLTGIKDEGGVTNAGLRMTFDPTKSPHYKLVDAGCTSCDIDIQIYFQRPANGAYVVQYNLISKTLHEIYDCGSNQLLDNHDDNDDADDDELLQ
ncbi:hypothetical protein Tco_0648727 [Tanacetum coccineum]